jgi:hypothetical protein
MDFSKAFAQSLNGKTTKVGYMEIDANEEFIIEAMHLPIIGENWSKNYLVKKYPGKNLWF